MDSKSLEAWRSATILNLQTYRSQKICARLSKLQMRLIPGGRRSKWTRHVEVGGTRGLKILRAPERWYHAPFDSCPDLTGNKAQRGIGNKDRRMAKEQTTTDRGADDLGHDRRAEDQWTRHAVQPRRHHKGPEQNHRRTELRPETGDWRETRGRQNQEKLNIETWKAQTTTRPKTRDNYTAKPAPIV